jgi:hypothetical protein
MPWAADRLEPLSWTAPFSPKARSLGGVRDVEAVMVVHEAL